MNVVANPALAGAPALQSATPTVAAPPPAGPVNPGPQPAPVAAAPQGQPAPVQPAPAGAPAPQGGAPPAGCRAETAGEAAVSAARAGADAGSAGHGHPLRLQQWRARGAAQGRAS